MISCEIRQQNPIICRFWHSHSFHHFSCLIVGYRLIWRLIIFVSYIYNRPLASVCVSASFDTEFIHSFIHIIRLKQASGHFSSMVCFVIIYTLIWRFMICIKHSFSLISISMRFCIFWYEIHVFIQSYRMFHPSIMALFTVNCFLMC